MGWEVFYQATLIPIAIYLIEFMSNRESNCNFMTYRSHIIRGPVMSQSCLLCHRYELFFIPYHYDIDIILLLIYVNFIIIISMEPYPPDRLKARVAMILADQIAEVCRYNIGWNLGGMQSMPMVTTQPFANRKRAIKCQLTYLLFCIASKPLSARG